MIDPAPAAEKDAPCPRCGLLPTAHPSECPWNPLSVLPPGIRETRGTHTIEAECLHCGCDGLWPNKGLGRATYATWRTRHGANCHVLPPVDSDCACGHDHGVSTTTCDRCYWCQQETA